MLFIISAHNLQVLLSVVRWPVVWGGAGRWGQRCDERKVCLLMCDQMGHLHGDNSILSQESSGVLYRKSIGNVTFRPPRPPPRELFLSFTEAHFIFKGGGKSHCLEAVIT